jgi:hypothetical protein
VDESSVAAFLNDGEPAGDKESKPEKKPAKTAQ